MYIKVNFLLSFCITITIICVNKLVWAGDKVVESNTIVVQNGNDGGDDDHDEESSIIYTPIPIPIPMKLKKSIVNPSYLYPIHQDPSMPSYRMTQRSIIHVPSPAPNLQPTPNNFYSRFRTVPPAHYALPPSYNDRLPMPIHPSSNERQSSQSSQPQPPPPPLVFSSPIPPPLPLSGPVPTGPPMHLSQSRPSVSTNSPSFFPPIQPIPSVAQVSDDRDNRYFSLHEPWPPAYTNTNGDKNTIKMTTSTEVQNDGNSEVLPEDERNPNNNANNNNMAGPDDGRNGLVDYPPADQDYGQNYQANYDRPDYPANTDYREDYQAKANKPGGDGVTETVDEGNGGGIDDDYYQDYQNPRDYNDYQGKQVGNDVAQSNLNYPSDSQEVVNYHNQDANDYQVAGQEPVYGDGYPANELPNQSNEQKQSNYEEGNHQSSQSTSLPPSPQTDYTQDYADDYYSSGNGQGTSNEQTDVNNNQIDNPDNNEEDENQRNDNERSFDQLAPKPLNQFTKESTSIPDRPMDYPYSSDGYNEPSMSPFESTPMVTIPLNPGTEPGVRPDPINEFDLTGDPYLDNYGRSMRDKSQPNSMENHINQINDGDYGKRNQQYHFNNVKDSSSRPNDYPLSNDQQNDDSTPPAQSNYNSDWPMENDYYQQNRQPMISQSAQPPSLQSPSSPSQLDSNRELDSPIDRYDPEDWGQY